MIHLSRTAHSHESVGLHYLGGGGGGGVKNFGFGGPSFGRGLCFGSAGLVSRHGGVPPAKSGVVCFDVGLIDVNEELAALLPDEEDEPECAFVCARVVKIASFFINHTYDLWAVDKVCSQVLANPGLLIHP